MLLCQAIPHFLYLAFTLIVDQACRETKETEMPRMDFLYIKYQFHFQTLI